MDVDYYSSGRIKIWKFALEKFYDKPIFGYGQSGFSEVYKKKYFFGSDCHNTYLNYLVDYGVIGFIVFILLFRQIFYSVKRRLMESSSVYNNIIYISFLSGFLGFLISIFFVNIYSLMSLVFIYIAVIYKYMDFDSKKTEQEVCIANVL
jgi:O-antigen ligase